jgi:hypothetical protein
MVNSFQSFLGAGFLPDNNLIVPIQGSLKTNQKKKAANGNLPPAAQENRI